MEREVLVGRVRRTESAERERETGWLKEESCSCRNTTLPHDKDKKKHTIQIPVFCQVRCFVQFHSNVTTAAVGCQLTVIPVSAGSTTVHCYTSIYKLFKFRPRNCH